ncbi:MAG: hypothetical protein KKH88_02595 [Nanoarchaeota archaeon]|nr:hypothetical protein [Nanoarchaeota archaeon]
MSLISKLTPWALLVALGIAVPAVADEVSVDSQYEYSLENGLKRNYTTVQINDNENDESLLGDLILTVRDTQGEELPAALLQYDWNNWGVGIMGKRSQPGEAVVDGSVYLNILPPKTKNADPRLTAVVEAGFNGGAEPIYRSGALRAREMDFGFMNFSGDAAFFQNYGEELDAQDHGFGWAAFFDNDGFVSVGRRPEDHFMNGYLNLGAFAIQNFSRFDQDDPHDLCEKFIFAIDPNENYFSAPTMSAINGETILDDTFFPDYHPLNWKGSGQLTYIHTEGEGRETYQLEAGAQMNNSLAIGLGFIECDGQYDLTGSIAVDHKFGRATVAGEAIWNGLDENLETYLGIKLLY